MTRTPGRALALSLTATAGLLLDAAPPQARTPLSPHGRHVVVTMAANAPVPLEGLPESVRLRSHPSISTWVLETPSPETALETAERLRGQPGVITVRPAQCSPVRPHFARSPIPNDPYFSRQYALEPAPGTTNPPPPTVALNLRGAWAYTRGEGVVVGVGDDGMERAHPDLAANVVGPHHNFLTDTDSGDHATARLYHGTAVSGVIAAVGDNRKGVTGTAPRAGLASWVIFDNTDTNQPDEAGFAELFGTANQTVGVQNHSWGNYGYSFVWPGPLEIEALDKALQDGRGGRGVVFVRSAGNNRQLFSTSTAGDVNIDGYANHISQITVGAVRVDGSVASYSTPGACILVAAPGGERLANSPGLVTTDRMGSAGRNVVWDPKDPQSIDYLVGDLAFTGTSAAAPLVSGVAALLLSARPDLRWFEVQQILALAARHVHQADPDLRTNGAGFAVSENIGFGIPDAGAALRLARAWIPRPAPVVERTVLTTPQPIPDAPAQGLRWTFAVSNTLVLQHVQVRVDWTHPRGRDLEVRLTAPSGLTSRLLRSGTESEPVPEDWTFSTVHHLGESSVGEWRLEVTDTSVGESGQLREAELILGGRAIVDTDRDGLDDVWERGHFGDLAQVPAGDPDRDGWSNASEQFSGRDPSKRDEPLDVTVGREPDGRLRLSWPSGPTDAFELRSSDQLQLPFPVGTPIPGQFPEVDWWLPAETPLQLFEVVRPAP
ncbi:MAG: S8 family peptidase [Limisphaerales bacterium]